MYCCMKFSITMGNSRRHCCGTTFLIILVTNTYLLKIVVESLAIPQPSYLQPTEDVIEKDKYTILR